MNEDQGVDIQSIINQASEKDQQPDVEEKKSRFSLPSFSIDSLYQRNHIRREVQLGIGLYVLFVIVPILFFTYQRWQESRNLQVRWERQQVSHVEALQNINLADFVTQRNTLFSAFQETRNPIYAVFFLESLAREAGVTLNNQHYSRNSRAEDDGAGVLITAHALGEYQDLLAFIQLVETYKPLLEFGEFTVIPDDTVAYRAAIDVTVSLVAPVPPELETVEAKLEEPGPIPYPVPQLESILAIVEQLKTIPFPTINRSPLGKDNLFE